MGKAAIGGALFDVGGGPDSYQGLLGGVSDGFGAAFTNVFGKLGPYVQAGVSGAIGNALTQGAGMLFGMQKKFSWREVAASAVAGTVGYGAGKMLNPSAGRSLGNLAKRTLNGVITGAAHASVTGGKIHFEDIVTDAFGNAIGNSIVDEIHNAGVTRQTKSLLKDAGYAYDRDDHRSSAEFTEKLIRAGATRDEALAILRNTEVRSALLDNDAARAGGISDELASTRAGNAVAAWQRGDTASGDLEEVVVTAGRVGGPGGETIAQKVFSGGIHLVEGLTQLEAEHPVLAGLAFEAGKGLLTGGPLKTIVTKLAETTFDGAVGAASGYLSGKAQSATERFITDLAQRNNVSFDLSIAGVNATIGPETFGMAAGQVAGGAVDTVFAGGLKQISERGGEIRNVVGGRRGSQRTRDDIDIQRDRILQENPTWTHRNGGTDQVTGRPLPEMYVPGQGGQRKGSTYPDLTFEKPDGTLHHHNTVDTYSDGTTLTRREAENLERLRQLRQNDTATTSPKPR